MKTRSEYIKVEPWALFTSNIVKNNSNYVVNFDNESKGSNLTYHWDFGDGRSSSKENPKHIYRHLGYDVTLTVTDDVGYEDNITRTLE